MHDPRVLIEAGEDAVRRLGRRGYVFDPAALQSLLERRNRGIQQADELRARSKKVAQEVGRAAKAGADVEQLKQEARTLKDELARVETDRDQAADELARLLLEIPNLPLDRCPDGFSDADAEVIRTCGEPTTFDFPAADHVDLGERLGIFDFARATKLSGPRFSVARGPGAVLERALASFFLQRHTTKHGYLEYSVPYLVGPAALQGTGQLPKFAEDLFRTETGGRELYLVPTAEVPLTNLHAGDVLAEADLPLAYTAWTPCFRSEAGSYGRDTRGLIRLHQFAKVELVRFCAAERSQQELEVLVGHAESLLQELGLVYRVVLLAAGDTGFGAQLTYDLEVWLPGQQAYREISSCSDFGTFQARRANIRTSTADGRREPVATLNGSGLPIGRTLAAVLEQGQQADGSVELPEALVPFAGFRRITADGTTE